ncbi:MAG: hypothetical protein HYU66_25270 [Armatimonadetes bacterium]|nr:hypothetical protein [Armatimonadota bacterium]
MARWAWLATVLTAAAAFAQVADLAPGTLYAVDLKTGAATPLGAYRGPSVDPANRLLYAVDAAGNLVRWSIDKLEDGSTAFVTPQEKEPPFRVALAAPRGGLVAAVREYIDRERDGTFTRVCLDVFDSEGKPVAGPVPLFEKAGPYEVARAAAWRSTGDLLALAIHAGKDPHALCVLDPVTKALVRFISLSGRGTDPYPLFRWQPDGRLLSFVNRGELILRGGSAYALFRKMPAPGERHCWLDSDHLALLDLERGFLLRSVEGTDKGTIPGWANGPESAPDTTVPVLGGLGVAWVTTADDAGKLQLRWLPADARDKGTVLGPTFARAGLPYTQQEIGPCWHPDQPVVYLATGREAKPSPAPASAADTPKSGR